MRCSLICIGILLISDKYKRHSRAICCSAVCYQNIGWQQSQLWNHTYYRASLFAHIWPPLPDQESAFHSSINAFGLCPLLSNHSSKVDVFENFHLPDVYFAESGRSSASPPSRLLTRLHQPDGRVTIITQNAIIDGGSNRNALKS